MSLIINFLGCAFGLITDINNYVFLFQSQVILMYTKFINIFSLEICLVFYPEKLTMSGLEYF